MAANKYVPQINLIKSWIQNKLDQLVTQIEKWLAVKAKFDGLREPGNDAKVIGFGSISQKFIVLLDIKFWLYTHKTHFELGSV